MDAGGSHSSDYHLCSYKALLNLSITGQNNDYILATNSWQIS